MNPTEGGLVKKSLFYRHRHPEGYISSIIFQVFQSWWSQCPHFRIVVGSPSWSAPCYWLGQDTRDTSIRCDKRYRFHIISPPHSALSKYRDPTRELAAKSNLHRDFGTLAWICFDLSQFPLTSWSNHWSMLTVDSIAHSQSSITAASLKDFLKSLDVQYFQSMFRSARLGWCFAVFDRLLTSEPGKSHRLNQPILGFIANSCKHLAPNTHSSCMSWHDLNSFEFIIWILFIHCIYLHMIFAVLHDNSWNLHP